MTFYNNATICTNGHVISSTTSNSTPYCKSCGKETISKCQHCETTLRGAFESEYSFEINYGAPSYCYICGKPFPWTEILINNAVELISLDDDLSDEIKEVIKNALPDLIIDTPSTPVATAKYKKFIPSAAKYVQDGLRNILIDVTSETVKKSLWG
ncbi:DUF2321 domain-containing protein [Lysinibacillus xylanilyticus]|uniref:DUF2321 domain-containing protein n=1 Tax=Lysinibacillus xylanilyticus TaxID=582475 RepID=UPI003800AFC9